MGRIQRVSTVHRRHWREGSWLQGVESVLRWMRDGKVRGREHHQRCLSVTRSYILVYVSICVFVDYISPVTRTSRVKTHAAVHVTVSLVGLRAATAICGKL